MLLSSTFVTTQRGSPHARFSLWSFCVEGEEPDDHRSIRVRWIQWLNNDFDAEPIGILFDVSSLQFTLFYFQECVILIISKSDFFSTSEMTGHTRSFVTFIYPKFVRRLWNETLFHNKSCGCMRGNSVCQRTGGLSLP